MATPQPHLSALTFPFGLTIREHMPEPPNFFSLLCQPAAWSRIPVDPLACRTVSCFVLFYIQLAKFPSIYTPISFYRARRFGFSAGHLIEEFPFFFMGLRVGEPIFSAAALRTPPGAPVLCVYFSSSSPGRRPTPVPSWPVLLPLWWGPPLRPPAMFFPPLATR